MSVCCLKVVHTYSDIDRHYMARQAPSPNLRLSSHSGRRYIIKRLRVELERLRSLSLCSSRFKEKSERPRPESQLHAYVFHGQPTQLPLLAGVIIYRKLPVVCNTLPLSLGSLPLGICSWHSSSKPLPTYICLSNSNPALKYSSKFYPILKSSTMILEMISPSFGFNQMSS